MSLNVSKINSLKPTKKQKKVSDGEGLYILIKPNGKKFWRLKYRFVGKERTLSIGEYPTVSLKAARLSKDQAKSLLAQNIDPNEEKRRQKAKQSAETFEIIAREWHEQKKGTWKLNHANSVLQSLEREVFPYIGNRELNKLTPPDMLAVIRRIEHRGALDIAARVLGRCNNVFKYAVQTGRATHNPTSDLSGTIKTRKVKHMNALKREQLPKFIEKLDTYQGSIITKLAIQLILITFVRTNELRYARWEEFNFDKKEWVIPAKRMKMKREHIVPLSGQTLALLEVLRQITGHYKLLFPSEQRSTQPISNNTMLYGLYRMGYKGKTTIHGFRSTASTILNESGFNPDAIEAALAHIDSNKVRSAYNRSQYLKERVELMEWWGSFLDAQRAGGSNIIPLRVNQ